MPCIVPANQPIYEALITKAKSYPADKVYQSKAYMTCADKIANMTKSIYDDLILGSWYSGGLCGIRVEAFINEFIKANPPAPAPYTEDAMNEARRIAAQNAPVDHTPSKNTTEEIIDNINNKFNMEAFLDEFIKANLLAPAPYTEDAINAPVVNPIITPPAPCGPNQAIVNTILSNPTDDVALSNEFTKIMEGSKTREEALARLEPILKSSIQQAFIESVFKNAVMSAPSMSDTIMDGIMSGKFITPPHVPNPPPSENLVDKKINQLNKELKETSDESYRNILMQRQVQRVQRREEINQQEQQEHSKVEIGSIIADGVRCSARLAGKPAVKYYESDSEEENDDDTIADIIQSTCKAKKWNYRDELITEYKTWRAGVTENSYTHKYNYVTHKYDVPVPERQIIRSWALYYSELLKNDRKLTKIKADMRLACKRMNIIYQNYILDKFMEWRDDPANKSLVTISRYSVSVGDFITYDNTGYKCIKKWLSSLKKSVTF